MNHYEQIIILRKQLPQQQYLLNDLLLYKIQKPSKVYWFLITYSKLPNISSKPNQIRVLHKRIATKFKFETYEEPSSQQVGHSNLDQILTSTNCTRLWTHTGAGPVTKNFSLKY